MRNEQDWTRLEQENRELREKVSQQEVKLAQREEFIVQLQQTIAELSKQVQQGSQGDEEVAQLRQIVAELTNQMQIMGTQVKDLQERLTKDSHNSHLPPSSDRFAKPKKTKSLRKASGNKPGGQEGHTGNTLYQVANPDQIITHAVSTCSACQGDLRNTTAHSVERRQVFDIPPKRVVVIEHQAEQKVCPDCQAVTRAPFPEGVSAPVQYSPAFGAIAVYLTQQQFLPYERASETIQDLIGPAMTVGTIKNMVQRCAENLEPIEEQIKEHLRIGDVLHKDETSLRVMGKRKWRSCRMHRSSNLLHGPCQTWQGSRGGYWDPLCIQRDLYPRCMDHVLHLFQLFSWPL